MAFIAYGFANPSITANEHEPGEEKSVRDSGHLSPITTKLGLCVNRIRGLDGFGQEQGWEQIKTAPVCRAGLKNN